MLVSDKKIRLLTADDIRNINRTPGNRRVSNEIIARMDKRGVHVFAPLMVHNEMEMRGLLLIKPVGTMEPIHVYFDIPLGRYYQLECA